MKKTVTVFYAIPNDFYSELNKLNYILAEEAMLSVVLVCLSSCLEATLLKTLCMLCMDCIEILWQSLG